MSVNNDYKMKVICDGVTAFVFKIKEQGQKITISGWSTKYKALQKGDTVLVVQGQQEARYKVDQINYMNDPKDQYFMDLEFYPRITVIN